MKEFVEYIVKQLVEYPDKVVVTEDEVDGRTVVSVKVEKPDMAHGLCPPATALEIGRAHV